MKALFFFLIFSISLTLNAQITKNNWLVGGSGSFSSNKATTQNNNGDLFESKATGLQLDPNIGYFFADKFAAGLNVNINFSNPPQNNNSNWAAGLGPFVRYYFLNTDKLINIFGASNFIFSKGLSESNKGRNSTLYGFSLGGVVFFNSSVGLELSLNYSDTTSRNEGFPNTSFNNFLIGLGFQIHLEK